MFRLLGGCLCPEYTTGLRKANTPLRRFGCSKAYLNNIVERLSTIS